MLLGDPGRSYFPKTGLTQLATYSVPTTRELEDREIRETGVWRLDRRSGPGLGEALAALSQCAQSIGGTCMADIPENPNR